MAGSRQFITPHSKDVYTIIDVLKGGFSLRLLNLCTLGELTCVHTRVDYLSLEDIDGYELGTNNIWDNLTDLNKLNHQTFKLGNANRKLQLIHPQADDEQGGDDEGLGLGEEDDQEVREDNLDLLTRTD